MPPSSHLLKDYGNVPYQTPAAAIGEATQIDLVSDPNVPKNKPHERPVLRCISKKGNIYFVWPVFGRDIKGDKGTSYPKGKFVGYTRYRYKRAIQPHPSKLPMGYRKMTKAQGAVYLKSEIGTPWRHWMAK